MSRQEWVPVAPTWERSPDAGEIWRHVVTMPSLALNQVELELVMPVAGRRLYVLGVGDGMAALALAGLGAQVTAVDASASLLDVLLVRTQVLGVHIELMQSDLADLADVKTESADFCYAAQLASQLRDLGRFYAAVRRVLVAGGRLIVNEYHPFRRIWKQEPGHPRIRYSYFHRIRPRNEFDPPDPTRPGAELGRFEYHWPIADHVYHLIAAGLQIAALEEVGDVRQHWEVPNLKGIPEQLIIAADRPAAL